ncbi:MAG: DUF4271 domain-containing protein [Paludibacteraceae bacterium]|nr:DUF4271 domain-containing protein [Paludibacteraceae bacterium]
MNELLRISSPVSEPWTAWVMLALLICLLWAAQRQHGLFLQACNAVFGSTRRAYNDVTTDTLSLLLTDLFTCGSVALTVMMTVRDEQPFLLRTYGLTLLLVLAAMFLSNLLTWLLNYVFRFDRNSGEEPVRLSGRLAFLAAFLCYPLTMLAVQLGMSRALLIILCVIAAAWLILLMTKAIQRYTAQPRHVAYALIYVLTVHMLPLLAVLYAAQHFA